MKILKNKFTRTIKKYVVYFFSYLKIKQIEGIKNKSIKESVNLQNIWEVSKNGLPKPPFTLKLHDKISLLGVNTKLGDWSKDPSYPMLWNEKKYSFFFKDTWNLGQPYDIKIPLELSRFNFLNSMDRENAKKCISHWIDNNPFCKGINWLITMDVSIRAINWIVWDDIINFSSDESFKQKFTMSLIEHAEFISAFPEIYKKGHTTNHTTADYAGLLFLALTLHNHPKSKIWLQQAVNGLTDCIKSQTYDDGVNFEASIPYHRLVLEMFAYSSILCLANNIKLPKIYYQKLFKMFEYTSAYIDENGNAPQFGDNDSGRILIFQQNEEHDHSYLLDLGEYIFDYKFLSKCQKRNSELIKFLPKIKKIRPSELDLDFRKTDNSINFQKGGAYILKNSDICLFVSCFPLGTNGSGSHNHLDSGSFTLTYKGFPIIVDPGTFTYTRNKEKRDLFRSRLSHNVALTKHDNLIDLRQHDFWALKNYYITRIINFSNNELEIEVTDNFNNLIKRKFFIDKNTVFIEDKYDGGFESLIHFHHNIKSINFSDKTLESNCFKITGEFVNFKCEDYSYSNSYGSIALSKKVRFSGNQEISFLFTFR